MIRIGDLVGGIVEGLSTEWGKIEILALRARLKKRTAWQGSLSQSTSKPTANELYCVGPTGVVLFVSPREGAEPRSSRRVTKKRNRSNTTDCPRRLSGVAGVHRIHFDESNCSWFHIYASTFLISCHHCVGRRKNHGEFD